MFLRKAVKNEDFSLMSHKRNDRIQLMKKILWIIFGVFSTLFLFLTVFMYFESLKADEEVRRWKGLVRRPYVPQKVFLEKFTGLPIEESRYIKGVQAEQPIIGVRTNATLFEATPEEIEKIVARFSMPRGCEEDWRMRGKFPEYEINKERLVKCKHGNRYLDVAWYSRSKHFTRDEMEKIVGKIELESERREYWYAVHLYYSPELSTAIISITAP